MWWNAFKYIIIGAVIFFIASLFLANTQNFVAQSEPAQLIVLQVDDRRNSDGKTMYRPVFGLETADRPRPEYAGNTWMRPAPHQAGDIVTGRINRDSGEMRSDHMSIRSSWMLRVAQIIGIFAILQGGVMLFGVPEIFLPLRVRFGRSARY